MRCGAKRCRTVQSGECGLVGGSANELNCIELSKGQIKRVRASARWVRCSGCAFFLGDM